MGTMQDQLRKVIDSWDTTPEPTTQATTIKKENTVVTDTNAPTTQTGIIIKYVQDNPGLTGMELASNITEKHKNISRDNVFSFLSQLSVAHRLNRVETGEVYDRTGRRAHRYYVNTEEQRKEAVAKEERARSIRDKRIASAVLARAAKAKKKEMQEMQERKAQAKAQAESRVNVELPKEVAPRTMWTAQDALNGLSVLQARELYNELKKIFGA